MKIRRGTYGLPFGFIQDAVDAYRARCSDCSGFFVTASGPEQGGKQENDENGDFSGHSFQKYDTEAAETRIFSRSYLKNVLMSFWRVKTRKGTWHCPDLKVGATRSSNKGLQPSAF